MISSQCFAFVCFWCYAVVQAPYREGDVMLGGLFSVRQLQETSEDQCGEITKEVANAEAMIFAIDKINNDSNLLPNISLGYDIQDYCESNTKATQITYEMFQKKCFTNTTRSNMGKRSIVALIGPTYSSTALIIGGFLQMINVSAIGGSTTSPELSSYTYKHLYRTVPSDTYLAKAVADIIEHFNWTYVAAVAVDDSYGRNGVWSVIKEAENKNGSFCVAATEFIPHNTKNSSIRHIVTKLRRHENIRVIILWIYGTIVRSFFKEVKRQNLSGRVWVLSEIAYTLTGNGFLPSDLSPLHGSIAFQPHNFQDEGFKEYMRALLYNAEGNNQDLPEWWGEIMKLNSNCLGRKDNATHKNRQKELCVHNIIQDMYSTYVPHVIDAVYSVAHALDISTQDTNLTDNDCPRKLYLGVNDMQRLLSKVNFMGLTGKVLFNEFGDRQSAFYDVINFQQVQEADAKGIKQVIVGKWDVAQRLHLDDNIYWNSQNGLFPKSECLDQCSAGTRKSTTSPCCWQCVPCPRGTINPVPGAQSCMECSRGKRSNEARTACVDLPLANLSYTSAGGIAILVFAVLGIIATLFSFAVIYRFWNTSIVRACNRKLSLAFLGIILLVLFLVLLNLFKPTRTICKIIYPWRYLTYNLCLSLLLVKVLRIASAFQVPILPSLTTNSLTNRMHAVIVITLQTFLIIVLLPWLLLDPPVIMEYIYPERYTFIKCKAYNASVGKTMFLTTCSYIFFQLLISAYCFFKVRNIPENFSEAKRMAFSMYIFFISLLAYHTVEFSMDEKYVTVVDCVTTLLSAYGFVCCVFLPKIYIILLRPELNTSARIGQEVTQFSFASSSVRINPAFDRSTQQGRTSTNLASMEKRTLDCCTVKTRE
ncbi:extracellular calcium-sensing receptor-like [Oculina patagonica]